MGESSPYFVHMASHTFHDVSPMHLHEHLESVVHPSHSPEGTTPCLSPPIEGGVAPHVLPLQGTLLHPPVAPIASPSSPLPHVGDQEPPYSPPSHDLVPIGLLDSSGSFVPDTGCSLSRGASCSRAEQIARRHFHGLDVPSQVQVLEELLRLPSMATCVQAALISSPRTRRTTTHMVQSLWATYSRLSRRSLRDALAAWHAIVCSITAPGISGSIRSTSRLLAIPQRTLRDGVRWRLRLDAGDPEALWAISGRAPRSSRLLVPEIRQIIERFWEEHSRASPDFGEHCATGLLEGSLRSMEHAFWR